MKRLIDITDEDVLAVVNSIYLLTENNIVGRGGDLGLDFHASFKKYGTAHIDIERVSVDRVTDGHWTTESKSRIVFNHQSVWFAELDCDGDPSNYNKNHFFGYLKLQELGYALPTTPQW